MILSFKALIPAQAGTSTGNPCYLDQIPASAGMRGSFFTRTERKRGKADWSSAPTRHARAGVRSCALPGAI